MKPRKATTRTAVALLGATAVLAGIALAGAGTAQAAPVQTGTKITSKVVPVAGTDAPRWT